MVEQPIAARQVTGSNPVGPFRLSVWLNWIEYLTTDQKVPGSSPGSDKCAHVAWAKNMSNIACAASWGGSLAKRSKAPA